ncbi:MAG: hypothetical protein Q9219_002650 [cf. Caloplaca sp. 3 TL-2023]
MHPPSTIILLAFASLASSSITYHRPAALNTQLISQIETASNNSNNIIPGGSPFIYIEDPAKNGFSISSISVTPTPCSIGLPCELEAKGTFRDTFDAIHLSLDISVRLKSGGIPGRIIAVRDDLCEWATVKQGSRVSCPPRAGVATVGFGLDLVPWFVKEGTYWIDLKLEGGGRLLTHIGALFRLEDLDPDRGATATS